GWGWRPAPGHLRSKAPRRRRVRIEAVRARPRLARTSAHSRSRRPRAPMRALRGAGAEALAVLETCAGEARARALTLERGLLTLELGQSEKAERLLRLADVRKPRIGASTRPWAPHLPPVASSKRPRSSSAEPWPWRPTTRACSATLPSPWRSTARPRKPRRCCARRGCPARRRLKWRRILALVLGLRDRFDEAKL